MAAWQFRIKVLPEKAVIAAHGKVPDQLKIIRYRSSVSLEELERQADSLPKYWSGDPAERAISEAFSEILPEVESWSEEGRMFGDNDGDNIEIWESADGNIESVVVAVSLSKPDKAFIGAILDTAEKHNCVLHSIGSMAVVKPNPENFVRQAVDSSAHRFIPEGYDLSQIVN